MTPGRKGTGSALLTAIATPSRQIQEMASSNAQNSVRRRKALGDRLTPARQEAIAASRPVSPSVIAIAAADSVSDEDKIFDIEKINEDLIKIITDATSKYDVILDSEDYASNSLFINNRIKLLRDLQRAYKENSKALLSDRNDLHDQTERFLLLISLEIELLDRYSNLISGNLNYSECCDLIEKIEQELAGHRMAEIDLEDAVFISYIVKNPSPNMEDGIRLMQSIKELKLEGKSGHDILAHLSKLELPFYRFREFKITSDAGSPNYLPEFDVVFQNPREGCDYKHSEMVALVEEMQERIKNQDVKINVLAPPTEDYEAKILSEHYIIKAKEFAANAVHEGICSFNTTFYFPINVDNAWSLISIKYDEKLNQEIELLPSTDIKFCSGVDVIAKLEGAMNGGAITDNSETMPSFLYSRESEDIAKKRAMQAIRLAISDTKIKKLSGIANFTELKVLKTTADKYRSARWVSVNVGDISVPILLTRGDKEEDRYKPGEIEDLARIIEKNKSISSVIISDFIISDKKSESVNIDGISRAIRNFNSSAESTTYPVTFGFPFLYEGNLLVLALNFEEDDECYICLFDSNTEVKFSHTNYEQILEDIAIPLVRKSGIRVTEHYHYRPYYHQESQIAEQVKLEGGSEIIAPDDENADKSYETFYDEAVAIRILQDLSTLVLEEAKKPKEMFLDSLQFRAKQARDLFIANPGRGEISGVIDLKYLDSYIRKMRLEEQATPAGGSPLTSPARSRVRSPIPFDLYSHFESPSSSRTTHAAAGFSIDRQLASPPRIMRGDLTLGLKSPERRGDASIGEEHKSIAAEYCDPISTERVDRSTSINESESYPGFTRLLKTGDKREKYTGRDGKNKVSTRQFSIEKAGEFHNKTLYGLHFIDSPDGDKIFSGGLKGEVICDSYELTFDHCTFTDVDFSNLASSHTKKDGAIVELDPSQRHKRTLDIFRSFKFLNCTFEHNCILPEGYLRGERKPLLEQQFVSCTNSPLDAILKPPSSSVAATAGMGFLGEKSRR